MAAITNSNARPTPSSGVHGRTSVRNDGANSAAAAAAASSSSSAMAVAHTLTACTRCRQRKTRCDTGLPKCGPCERTNSTCEYYDSNKGQVVNRSYVVYLQHKVRELEEELGKVENEDGSEDAETMMRAASVRMYESRETKFLGPASGIAITRLVMQLAKQFTDAKSIKDIVPDAQAKHIKELYQQEQAKPTSKTYPVTSNVAAPDLPTRDVAGILVQLYKVKVQPMYPALHEPTLDQDVQTVYEDAANATPFQNFVVRMVIAISLQKTDTFYAGLADSFYLAALQYMEPCVRLMDLQTLQCFALMAEYSLLTPTRTAIYFLMGVAVRLVQALGFHEEKTITRGRGDSRADPLEIDMRRRLFWCIFVMDCGLAHSLGRPATLATGLDHIDVGWFETCEDAYITPSGTDPAARPTLKKWVAIHFFKMRLLQLEIRRKLYLRKRPEPTEDSDPWFIQMDAKLSAWRDASPNQDGGHGLDKIWFIGRYNTMIVFLYRPSPQVPRPSLQAALKCFEACEYNIYMQREQIRTKNVDLTWIFTQSIFMAINTMLWSLSYVEVRRKHCRANVETYLDVAMEAIQLASERWPGVASAVQLYQKLIHAILKIYEKDEDVPISATTPSDAPSPSTTFPDGISRSRTTSPATVSTSSIATPPERAAPPFGYLHQQSRRSVEEPPPMPYRSGSSPGPLAGAAMRTPPLSSPQLPPIPGPEPQNLGHYNAPVSAPAQNSYPYHQYNPLPEFTTELTVPGWNNFQYDDQQPSYPWTQPAHQSINGFTAPELTDSYQNYPMNSTGMPGQANDQYSPQYWDIDGGAFDTGINQREQQELMHSLEHEGMEDIQSMITNTMAVLAPKVPQPDQYS